MKRTIAPGAIFSALVVIPNARAAQDDGRAAAGLFGAIHPELAGRLMGGTTPAQRAPGPIQGGGLGVRGGVAYGRFYGGLSFMDFLSGGSCTDGVSPSSCGSTHGAAYGVEGGFGQTFLGMLLVRGQLGMGDYVATTDGTFTECSTPSGGTFSTSSASSMMCTTTRSHAVGHYLYLEPGVLVALTLGPVLVGVDADIMYMPSISAPRTSGTSRFTAFAAGAQLGVRL